MRKSLKTELFKKLHFMEEHAEAEVVPSSNLVEVEVEMGLRFGLRLARG